MLGCGTGMAATQESLNDISLNRPEEASSVGRASLTFLLGETFQNAEEHDQATLLRSALGRGFLTDSFEPLLRFDNAINALNKRIEVFNQTYSQDLVHSGNESDGRYEAVFSQIDKENILYGVIFNIIQGMKKYVSSARTLGVNTEENTHLQLIYEVFAQLRKGAWEGSLEALNADLGKIQAQVGPGWHMKEGLYCDGLGEESLEDGSIVTVWPEGRTVFVEPSLPQPERSFLITRQVAQIGEMATAVASLTASLKKAPLTFLSLFSKTESIDQDKAKLFRTKLRKIRDNELSFQGDEPEFEANVSDLKLADGIILRLTDRFEGGSLGVEQETRAIRQAIATILPLIQRIARFAR